MISEYKRGGWRTGIEVTVLLLLAAYVGGYFVLSNVSRPLGDSTILRLFDSRWARQAYWPLGWIECKIRRTPIGLAHSGNPPRHHMGLALYATDGTEINVVMFNP